VTARIPVTTNGRVVDQVPSLLVAVRDLATALITAQSHERGGRDTDGAKAPIYVAAVDHRQALLDFLLGRDGQPGWLPRARAILGWSLPSVPLSRRDFLPCPYCLANSLWINREHWGVFCGNPECPQRKATGQRAQWWVRWATDGRPLFDEIAALSAAVTAVLMELMDEAAQLPPDLETAGPPAGDQEVG
jgi:hypothetical protein